MQTLEPEAKPKSASLQDHVFLVCRDLTGLDPGPLADLRRMDATSDQYGAPYFWRLCARYNLATGETHELKWAQVIQALAILTPRGRDEKKSSRHARGDQAAKDSTVLSAGGDEPASHLRRRGLGHVLCDGADPRWPDDPANPRPAFSEGRLAQLLGSSGETRVDLVLRVARFLASRLPAEATFDCTDLARLLLVPDDPKVTRAIARDYYARLDGARRTDSDDANSSPGDDA